jgi:PleD family two-component response regulator
VSSAFLHVSRGHPQAARGSAERGVASSDPSLLLRQTRGINVVCRYGGARFGVLLVETSKVGAQLYADRIRHVLSSCEFAHRRRMTAGFVITCLP